MTPTCHLARRSRAPLARWKLHYVHPLIGVSFVNLATTAFSPAGFSHPHFGVSFVNLSPDAPYPHFAVSRVNLSSRAPFPTRLPRAENWKFASTQFLSYQINKDIIGLISGCNRLPAFPENPHDEILNPAKTISYQLSATPHPKLARSMRSLWHRALVRYGMIRGGWNGPAIPEAPSLSGCSSGAQSIGFGSRGSQVQILPP